MDDSAIGDFIRHMSFAKRAKVERELSDLVHDSTKTLTDVAIKTAHDVLDKQLNRDG